MWSYTFSSEWSMNVDNAQKFCFPVSPQNIWIISTAPVLLIDIVAKFSTIKISKTSVRYGRMALWRVNREIYDKHYKAMIADANMRDSGTDYPVNIVRTD